MNVNKQDRTCAVVDIVQTGDKRVVEKKIEKIEKYQEIKLKRNCKHVEHENRTYR